MKGVPVQFKNRPNEDGTLSTVTIDDCLIANNGTPTSKRPQVIINLPKIDDSIVNGAWVEYEGSMYHVIGTTAKGIDENTPTRWNRYCIAEKIY